MGVIDMTKAKNIRIAVAALLLAALAVFTTGCGLSNLPEGELIESSVSPNGDYTVNAYLCDGGATTDFAIRCEVVNAETNECRNIYWNYHQSDVTLEWETDEVIIISGVRLNVLTDEYDWRDYI